MEILSNFARANAHSKEQNFSLAPTPSQWQRRQAEPSVPQDGGEGQDEGFFHVPRPAGMCLSMDKNRHPMVQLLEAQSLFGGSTAWAIRSE
jgi:hypothetical protein